MGKFRHKRFLNLQSVEMTSQLQGRDTQNNKTFKGRKHWFRHSADANFQMK